MSKQSETNTATTTTTNTAAGETKTKTAAVSEYTVAEFVKNAHVFGVPAEVVTVALREKQIKTATLDQAKKIVKDFLGRKV